MNDEIRKLLTEKVLGECWHEWEYYSVTMLASDDAGDYRCKLCKEWKGDVGDNRTFSTPQDAQVVKDALMKAGKWGEFCEFTLQKYHDTGNVDDIHEPFGWVDWLFSYTRDEKGNVIGYRLCDLAGEWAKEGHV